MTRKRTIMLGVAAAALVTTATAFAEPNRETALEPGGAGYAWDGGPLSGAVLTSDVGNVVPCGPGKGCDDTLIRAPRGQLSLKIGTEDPNATDLDLYLFESDDAGEPGRQLKSSAGGTSEEAITSSVRGGTYLVRVIAAASAEGTFKGEASLGVLPPLDLDDAPPDFGPDPAPNPNPNPDPGGGSTPPPSGGGGTTTVAPVTNIAPETSIRFAGARAVRGTALDRDGNVAYVDVAIVRVNGRRCSALRPNGRMRRIAKCSSPPLLRARGTKSWRLAMKKPLRPGRYVVYALATDEDGRTEGGFGRSNRVSFLLS